MQLNTLFLNELNGISTDFKAEVIAAEIIENDFPADRVLIQPLGAMNRPQNKDVESVLKEVSDYDNKEYLVIKTHKEGLYDKLPEGLFHTPISSSVEKTEEQVIKSIQKHRIEEKNARLFFLPFDTALNSSRVEIALYESQLDKKLHNNQLINIFSSHWEIFQHLNMLQSNIFLQFLPLIHGIRDNWAAIELLFEQMFLTPVRLSMRPVGKYKTNGEKSFLSSSLGEDALGVDFITGDLGEGSGFTEIVVTFGPLTAKKARDFTGELHKEKVVAMLCDYLLPANYERVILYEFAENDRFFSLSGADEENNNCSLGISTYLS